MELKISELARRSGLTVRALRHYDALGLLTPGKRTVADHRLYSHADLERLLQIQSLKALGLSLDTIGKVLDNPAYDPQEVIRQHICHVEEQLFAQQRILTRLRQLNNLQRSNGAELLDLIRMTREIEAKVDSWMSVARTVGDSPEDNFDTEQQAYISARIEALGHGGNGQDKGVVQDAWPDLMAKILTEMERGTDPKDTKVQALAERWQRLVQVFADGPGDLQKNLSDAYLRRMPSEMRAMWDYISAAMRAGQVETAGTVAVANLAHPDKNVRIRAALHLGAVRDRSALPVLTQRLGSEPDFYVREQLTWTLVQMTEDALPGVLALLEQPDMVVRLQAVHTLSKMKDRRATSALVKVLSDQDDEVARRAAFALGQGKDPESLQALLAGLGHEQAERRNTLSMALQSYGSSALPDLQVALQHSRQEVKVHAAETLGLIANPAAAPALAKVLQTDAGDSTNWELRFAVLSALGQLSGPVADEAIAQTIHDPDSRLRALAVRLQQDRMTNV